MTCDTYLSLLATSPVGDMAYADARDHAVTCRDCDRVTRALVDHERGMRMAFGEVSAPVPAGAVAARAIVLSRRRRIAFYYRIGLGVASAATALFLITSRRIGPAPSAVVKETFRLQCLSPAQAAEVLRPVIPPSVSISIQETSPVGVITVAAARREMVRVRSVLDRYDAPAESQCGVQLTVPKVIEVP